MPRTKSAGTAAVEAAINMDQVAQDLHDADAHNGRMQVIDSTYGTYDGEIVVYQRDRVIQEARFYLGQSAMSMLEAGKRLLLLKEHEPKGEWLDCLQRIGIDRTVAFRMMSASVKFGDVATSQHLLEAAGNKSKLIELLVLDDAQIQELENGGTVANLTLDDIERMSTSELRAALREARENEEATGRVLSEKNAKLDDMAGKLNKAKKHVKTLPPDDVAEEIRAEANTHAFEAEAVIRGQVRPAIEALYQHALAHGGDHGAFSAGLLAQIERAIGELRDEFNIANEPAADQTPEWAGSKGKGK